MTKLIQRISLSQLTIGFAVLFAVLPLGLGTIAVQAEEPNEPKSPRKMCGQCPEGYATTAVTESKEICKDGDPTLVQCDPVGANLMSVCGSCPGGYREIGNSTVPARCGNKEGGRVTQCQLEKMELNLPDPTQGGKTCPPDCGNTATPGQGALPPPPKYLPTPEKK